MHRNRVVENVKWMIGCKLLQSVLQLVLGMITARYLGPDRYGLVNYAASVTAFALPFVQLGLQSTLVQEFVSKPEQEGQILGTSLAMSAASGFVCMLLLTGFTRVANADEPETVLVCALYSVCLLFQSFELLQCWFHRKGLSKDASLAGLAAYGVVSGYKIWLLIGRRSIYWFALSHCAEYGAACILLLMLWKKRSNQHLSVSRRMAKDLFSRSRYYILAGIMVTVFQNTDHIMLKFLSGNEENGFYSAAITCTAVTAFVYAAIIDGARPAVLESKRRSQQAFQHSMICLYAVVIYLSLAQSLLFTVLAEPIVGILYGADYLPAVPVLRILVWMLAASNIGAVRNVWILAEGKDSVLWKINLCGVISNVGLNALFIPIWGAAGAAAASVLTQMIMNVAVGFWIRAIRPNNGLLVQSLDPRHLILFLD